MNAKTQKLPPGGGPIKGPEGEPQNDAGSVPDGGGANAMWGARFAAGAAAVIARLNATIGFERRITPQDIAASQAHRPMPAPPVRHLAVREVTAPTAEEGWKCVWS